VPDGHVAERIIVAARQARTTAGRHQPVLCRGRGAGVKRTALKTMDQTAQLSEIVLTGVKVGKDALVGKEGEGWKTIDRLADRGKVALCAELRRARSGARHVGRLRQVREQFGKPIGSFQAIQHKWPT